MALQPVSLKPLLTDENIGKTHIMRMCVFPIVVIIDIERLYRPFYLRHI